jgi:hypothetical protein
MFECCSQKFWSKFPVPNQTDEQTLQTLAWDRNRHEALRRGVDGDDDEAEHV